MLMVGLGFLLISNLYLCLNSLLYCWLLSLSWRLLQELWRTPSRTRCGFVYHFPKKFLVSRTYWVCSCMIFLPHTATSVQPRVLFWYVTGLCWSFEELALFSGVWKSFLTGDTSFRRRKSYVHCFSRVTPMNLVRELWLMLIRNPMLILISWNH